MMNKIHGLFLTLIISLVSLAFSSFIPLSSIALAIIIGAIIGNSFDISSKYESGINFSEKTLLAFAIALMGINLDFNVLTQLGFNTIFIIIISLILTLVFTIFLARKLNFEKDFGLILGIGNGICGSAAIAATKDILKINKDKSAIAIAIVNLLGTLGLFILPLVGYLLGFTDIQIGILLGNTLQSVGHAIAAGFGVNEVAGQSATIVKMGRILLLTPVILWLIYMMKKQNNSEVSSKIKIPFFIIAFIAFSIIATTNIFPVFIEETIAFISKISLLLAMSAIGIKISFKAIKQSGWQAFVFAGYIFKFQIILSIILIYAI